MPAAVISIGSKRRGAWSLLEAQLPGRQPEPLGILLLDEASNELTVRLRAASEFEGLEEQEIDILDALGADLEARAQEMGARGLIEYLEDSLSNFLLIGDRTAVAYSDAGATADRLFEEHVDRVREYETHLPLYSVRAAATRFGESMDAEPERWVRTRPGLRLNDSMFVAHVVGRSMEPRIPDGSLCVFRAWGGGTKKGRLLLIEMYGESDFAARYTIKRYRSVGEGDEKRVILEPLNPEFEAFELESEDDFRVIAEFVEVLSV
jgi:SOS-response transcriptional repressor LexA